MRKLILFLVAATVFTSCGGLKRIEKHVGPEVLSDTMMLNPNTAMVTMNMVVAVPPKYVTSQSCVTLSPVMTSQNNMAQMPQIIIKGRNFDKKDRRNQWLTGQGLTMNQYTVSQKDAREGLVIEYSESFPYQNWMANSTTTLYENCYACNKILENGQTLLAGGISYPVVPEVVEVIMIPVETAPVTVSEVQKTHLYYQINSAKIDPAIDGNAKEIAKIEQLLNNIAQDANKNISSISVNATASPDGNYESNMKLAQNRGNAIKTFLAKYINSAIPSSAITVNASVTPWSAILPYVAKSNLSQQSKNAIDKVVTQSKSMRICQRDLRAMKAEFKWIRDNVLPKLRGATYTVNYNVLEQ